LIQINTANHADPYIQLVLTERQGGAVRLDKDLGNRYRGSFIFASVGDDLLNDCLNL
jgi:hypothetical protein